MIYQGREEIVKYCYDKKFKIRWVPDSIDPSHFHGYDEASLSFTADIRGIVLGGSCSWDDVLHDLNEVLSRNPPEIEKVIQNGPAVVILWKDGTKTVAKCHSDDTFVPEIGFTVAFLKKLIGNKQYRELVEKYVGMLELY